MLWQTPGPVRTPHRTPRTKSIRRVARDLSDDNRRILGTPDYLSPELLLQQEHGLSSSSSSTN